MSKMWIVPSNDGEATAIIEMLERNGEEYIVTSQGWGASYEGLEPDIKSQIDEAVRNGQGVCGVELKGSIEGVTNIDHHVYTDHGTGAVDDRSNPKSSIEQVADILGVELSIEEQFVAANDKGFIPAMEKLGEELGIEGEELQAIIQNVRMKDRLAQGITLQQEQEAEEAIRGLGEINEKRRLISVKLPHSKTATVCDRLYGKYENLLVISGDGETNFFGSAETIAMLNERFPGGTAGGQLDQGSGYWFGYADQSQISKSVSENLFPERANKNTDQSDGFGDK